MSVKLTHGCHTPPKIVGIRRGVGRFVSRFLHGVFCIRLTWFVTSLQRSETHSPDYYIHKDLC